VAVLFCRRFLLLRLHREVTQAADEQTRGIQEVSCAGSSLEVEPAD
jgi:hypothetical protein